MPLKVLRYLGSLRKHSLNRLAVRQRERPAVTVVNMSVWVEAEAGRNLRPSCNAKKRESIMRFDPDLYDPRTLVLVHRSDVRRQLMTDEQFSRLILCHK